MKEEITRVLEVKNPQLPKNTVQYCFKDYCFVPVPPISKMQVLEDYEGTILHKESEEGRAQLAAGGLLGCKYYSCKMLEDYEGTILLKESEEGREQLTAGGLLGCKHYSCKILEDYEGTIQYKDRKGTASCRRTTGL